MTNRIIEELGRFGRAARAFAKGILRDRYLRIGALIYAGYWLLGLILPTPGDSALIEVAHMFAFAGMAMVAVTWLMGALHNVVHGKGLGENYLVISIALIALADSQRLGGSLIWRWAGQPQGWSLHPFWGSVSVMLFLGALAQLLSPGNKDGVTPPINARWVLIAWSIGAFMTGAFVTAFIFGRV